MDRSVLWPCAVMVVLAFGYVCPLVQGQPVGQEPGVAGTTCEDAAHLETSEAAGRSLDDRFQRLEGNVEAALLRQLFLVLEQRVERTEATVQKLRLGDRAERTEVSHSRLEAALQKLSLRIEKLGGHIDGVEATSSSTAAARQRSDGRIETALEGLNDRVEQLGGRIADLEATSKSAEAGRPKPDSRIEAAVQELNDRVEKLGSRIEDLEATSKSTEAARQKPDSRIEEKVETASGSTDAMLKTLRGLVERIDDRIATVETVSGNTEAALKKLDGRLGNVEAASGNMKAVLTSVERIGSHIERVEASSHSTESRLESINGRIERVEAATNSTEAVLRRLESIDRRVERAEAAGTNTEAVTESLGRIDGRMEAIKETVLDGFKRIDRRIESKASLSVEAAHATLEVVLTKLERMGGSIGKMGTASGNMEAMLRELVSRVGGMDDRARSGSTEALLQRLDDRLKVIEKTSVAAAEWDLSGMALEGVLEAVSLPFTLAGVQGLTLELHPQGYSGATAGHASLYLCGPRYVLMSFRLTLDNTTMSLAEPQALNLGTGWHNFCKAGTSFTRARVEVLEVVQKNL